MQKSLEIIKKTRIHLLELAGSLDIEQLNKVPEGFNNNIIWNLGHLVAAQQGVCYNRAGAGLTVDESFFEDYKPGSRPERFIDQAAAEEIKRLLFSTLDQFEQDYKAGIFSTYTPWVTRYGVNISDIDTAINFLPFHEGLHLGYVLAQKRVILK